MALVTDAHFGPPARHRGKLRKLSGEAPRLTQAFASEMRERQRPDVIVNLGDVVEDVDRDTDLEHYAAFVAALEASGCPVVHVAGNHDSVNLTDDDLRRLWGHDGPLFYSRCVAGHRLVVLRTVDLGFEVRLPREQLSWLERGLAEWREPVVVLMHHPAGRMDLNGNRWFEWWPHLCRLSNRTELRAVLAASPRVVAVFNGHAHWNHLSVVDGIPYVTLQSLIENVDDDAPGRAARASAVVEIDLPTVRVTISGVETLEHELTRAGSTP